MLTDHLLRREAGRMIAARTCVFGVHNLALAEDVVRPERRERRFLERRIASCR